MKKKSKNTRAEWEKIAKGELKGKKTSTLDSLKPDGIKIKPFN